MSYLSMIEGRLPPGFRFHPRDEELVCDYLEKRIAGDHNNIGCGDNHASPMMIDIDFNKCEPWDLPETACVGGKEWYFFSLRDRKYATGQRTNRATLSGYWKATGKDGLVARKGVLVGMRKTLVFYQGRAPSGRKTGWVMHEFRRAVATDPPMFSSKEDWVLCRVFFKSRSTTPKPKPAAPSTTAESFLDADGSSSSLPSLTETYFDFDHDPDSFHSQVILEGYEQVPCFSSPLTGAHSPQPPQHLPEDTTPWLTSSLFDGDVEMIRAVISHLTKLEGSHHVELLEP